MEEHKLIQSYLLDKYFISTAFRRASTPEEIWYYETIVWEYDKETEKRGKMLSMNDSGMSKTRALDNHFSIINELNHPKED